ncbi:MAG: hypothetical protein ISN29_12420 [Gammaproteobacteria bacterium AqS3]|nr:hypothetical protein [Gammaproteobacteria bacterium AqS3]
MLSNPLIINYHLSENCPCSLRACHAPWGRMLTGARLSDAETKATLQSMAEHFRSPGFRFEADRNGIDCIWLRLNITGDEPTLMNFQRLLAFVKLARGMGFEVCITTDASRPNKLPPLAPHLRAIILNVNPNGANAAGNALAPSDINPLCDRLWDVNPNLQVSIRTLARRGDFRKLHRRLVHHSNTGGFRIFEVSRGIERAPEGELFNKGAVQNCADGQKVLNWDVPPVSALETKQPCIRVNPEGRFFFPSGTRGNDHQYSDEIIKVGAGEAFRQIGFFPKKPAARSLAA